jgi:uncharacterized protein YjbI with pentapeptide repeats
VADHLRADCTRCVGLCCVALGFVASSEFAIDKPAGQACPNLQHDFRCAIHAHLRQRGFAACVAYDCFGAGQHVSQVTFAGQNWRQSTGVAEQMFGVFAVMRQLHELLWYVREARLLAPDDAALADAFAVVERLTGGTPDEIVRIDVERVRHEVNARLRQVSARLRGVGGALLDGADLVGKDLRARPLRGASLRGARLIGADLRGVDLPLADLTGADVRAADMRGADLAQALFVTQSQLESARGDHATRLSDRLSRPSHWALHSGRQSPTRTSGAQK